MGINQVEYVTKAQRQRGSIAREGVRQAFDALVEAIEEGDAVARRKAEKALSKARKAQKRNW